MLYTAKCFWPGVTEDELRHAADRVGSDTGQHRTVFRGALFHLLRWRRGLLPVLAAFVATSAAFAFYHVQLGVFGMANALLLCLPLGCLQWRYDGRAASLVGFHACADIVAFVLLYAGVMPGG